MPARKGTHPPAAGRGRTKGVPNRLTRELKDMILGALTESGGQAYLVRQASENPVAFMTLLGKVLPLQVAGDPENPITAITRIERVIVYPPARPGERQTVERPLVNGRGAHPDGSA